MALRLTRPFASMRLQARSLSSTPARFYPGPEDKGDKDPHAIENEKQKMMKGDSKSPIDSAPKWSPELASTSEQAVKADQDHNDSPKKLQEKTTPKTK